MKISFDLEDYKFETEDSKMPEGYTTLTLWVPLKVKEKYNEIQDRTNKKFSMALKEMAMKMIDSVKL